LMRVRELTAAYLEITKRKEQKREEKKKQEGNIISNKLLSEVGGLNCKNRKR